jgi:hypothetical protein
MYAARTIVAALLLTCVISVILPSSWADDDSPLEKGTSYFQAGQYYFATTWLERFIKNNPVSPQRKEALIMISRAYALSDRDEKAARYLDILRKEFPGMDISINGKEFRLTEFAPAPVLVTPPPVQKIVRTNGHTGDTVELPAKKSDRNEKPRSISSDKPPQTVLPPPQPKQVSRLDGGASVAPVIRAEKVIQPRQVPVSTAVLPIVPVVPPAPSLVAIPTPSAKRENIEVKPLPATSVVKPSLPRDVQVPEQKDGSYTLLVDKSVRRQKLKKQVEKLKAEGFQPVTQKINKCMIVFRLVAESFSGETAAQKYRTDISPVAKQAFVIRTNKQYNVVAASFFSVEDAQAGQKKFSRRKLRTEIVKSIVSMPVWLITVGSYSDSQQAEMHLKQLAEKGIDAVVTPRNM